MILNDRITWSNSIFQIFGNYLLNIASGKFYNVGTASMPKQLALQRARPFG
jgi:hypothetical protein